MHERVYTHTMSSTCYVAGKRDCCAINVSPPRPALPHEGPYTLVQVPGTMNKNMACGRGHMQGHILVHPYSGSGPCVAQRMSSTWSGAPNSSPRRDVCQAH